MTIKPIPMNARRLYYDRTVMDTEVVLHDYYTASRLKRRTYFDIRWADADAWFRARYDKRDHVGPWSDNATRRRPQVGMGVTRHIGGDRYPYTIVEVINDSTIRVVDDTYRCTSSDEDRERGLLTFEYGEGVRAFATILTYRMTSKRSGWFAKGQSIKSAPFSIGRRDHYLDPHF